MKLGVMRVVWGLISGVFGLITLIGMVARLLPAALSDLPLLPEIVSFTPWYCVTGAIALFAALMAHQTLRVWTMVICLALNVCMQVPLFAHIGVPQHSAQQSSNNQTLTVMTSNVYRGAGSVQDIVQQVRQHHVQILTMQETTADFEQELYDAGLDQLLPYHKRSTSDHMYGNDIWSAYPLDDVASDEVNSSASPMPAGSITLDSGAVVRFVSVHTTSPKFGSWAQWKRSIDEIGVLRNNTHATYVLMGDFNATLDHAPFRAMLGSRFSDGAYGLAHGYTMTWPANLRIPAMVGIDHVVVDRGITVTSMQTQTITGSDHKALIATLRIA